MYWFISQVIEFKDNIQRVMNENSVIKAIINQMILNSNENQNKMYELWLEFRKWSKLKRPMRTLPSFLFIYNHLNITIF